MPSLWEAAALCDHVWHVFGRGRIVIRQCLKCHEPDWDDLEAMIDRRARLVILAMAREVLENTTM